MNRGSTQFKPGRLRRPVALISHIVLTTGLLAACNKQPPSSVNSTPAAPSRAAAAQSPTPAAPPAAASPARGGESADSFFDPKNYPGAVQGSFVDPATLSSSERQYGMAPKRDSRVVYQDGVILMEHGDQAIRAAKADGMTFIFDAKAEHVDEFAEGKIVFATGRVVGRVGQISRNGDTVTVKLAPVSLTEVLKKGTFILDSTFSAKDLLFYSAPDFPNTIDVAATEGQQSRNLQREFSDPLDLVGGFEQAQLPLPSGLGKDLSTLRPPVPPMLPGPELSIGTGLKVSPAIGADGGIGINFFYGKDGVTFNAYGQLVLPSPRIRFLLDITASGIQTFGIEIGGAAALRMSIEAAADIERYINVNSTTVAPLDITLPCPIAGVPLALSFRTSFNLHTKFSAKRSYLSSSAAWSLSGTLFAGYKGGQQSFEKPSVRNTSSLGANASGISLGINTIGGGVNVRPMIGLGGFGFMTGVYLGITFTGEVFKQASEALVDCHGSNASASIDSGVGYKVPKAFAQLINGVLAIFTKYRLNQEGTLIPGWNGPLFNVNEDIPSGCAGLAGGAKAAAASLLDVPSLIRSKIPKAAG